MSCIAVDLRMDIWRQIRKDREKGAERLVSEYGNRLFAAAVLHYFADRSVEEIAVMLNVPAGTVKSRLHHAREGLIRLLPDKRRGKRS